MADNTLLLTVRKNATEEVRVQWSEFNGGRYLDVRVYALDGAEPVPTKKGICLSPALWQDILPTLERGVGADDSGPDET